MHATDEKRHENMGESREKRTLQARQKLQSDFCYGGDNNNNFSRQFLQVTSEMLQMAQVSISLLFSRG